MRWLCVAVQVAQHVSMVLSSYGKVRGISDGNVLILPDRAAAFRREPPLADH